MNFYRNGHLKNFATFFLDKEIRKNFFACDRVEHLDLLL